MKSTRKKNNYCLLFTLVLLSFSSVHAQKKKGRGEVQQITVPKSLFYEVVQYRDGQHHRAGQMAVSYKNDGENKKPVVVFIHGGGWANGDKDNVAYQIFEVAQQGFVGVSISYRLISEAPFPTCINDAKEAIRFLKSKANEWPIDTSRIGLWGYSAGAHLALIIALSPEELFKTSAYNAYNCSVKSVMAVSAPTDFVTRQKKDGYLNWMSEAQNVNLAFLQKVSPISYVSKEQVPIYMLHGTDDTIVKSYNYKRFEQECKQCGVANFKLFEFQGGNHMFYFKQKDAVKPVFNEFIKSL